MTFVLPIAAGGGEFLIWMVMLLFYGVAQFLRKKQTPGKPPAGRTPTSRRPASSPEQELKEFLKSLGQEVVDEPEPEPAPRPPPRPRPVVAAPRPRVAPKPVAVPATTDLLETERRMEVREQADVARPPPRPARKARKARPADSLFADVADVSHPVVRPDSFLVGLDSLRLPIVPLTTVAPHSQHHSGIQVDLRSRQEARQAMLYQFIMGPPKALMKEPDML